MIWLMEENGMRAVIKDFSVNGFFFRNTVGRFLVWRESKAYKRLQGLKGIPRFYRVIDGLALVIEAIPFRDRKKEVRQGMRLDQDFFDQLEELIQNIRKRGVAHCDLRGANVLLTREGAPYIIDWQSSISKSEFRFSPLTQIYRRFILRDMLFITKMKLNHIPDTVTESERARYAYRSAGERLLRTIRDKLRGLLQKIA